MKSAARLMAVGAILHVVALAISWLILGLLLAGVQSIPGAAEFLVLFAIVGTILQIAFAASAGFGAYVTSQGKSSAGTAMLVMGIIAAIVSLVVFGGIVGLVAGILTAYGGHKARARPPPPMWGAPPMNWMPPPPSGPRP